MGQAVRLRLVSSPSYPVHSKQLREAIVYHARNWGTPTPHYRGTGSENANSREGGRRPRSSQRPDGNRLDRVKDGQEWCTRKQNTISIIGNVRQRVSLNRPMNPKGVVLYCSYGHKASIRKAGCGESRTSGLERGKGCKALPIATGVCQMIFFCICAGRMPC